MIDKNNLKQGLENFTVRCKNLKNESLENLLTLYANIAILIDKSMNNYSLEIAYPAQALQGKIFLELDKRIKQ